MRRAALAPLAATVILAATGCGASSPSAWGGLKLVRVTVSRPSLPPPGGRPSTTTFSSPLGLTRARAALVAYQIHPTSAAHSGGCAGGTEIALAIDRAHRARLHLRAYRCGGRTTGNVGGNVTGFLSALGISVS